MRHLTTLDAEKSINGFRPYYRIVVQKCNPHLKKISTPAVEILRAYGSRMVREGVLVRGETEPFPNPRLPLTRASDWQILQTIDLKG
jgi:hypothetical protein